MQRDSAGIIRSAVISRSVTWSPGLPPDGNGAEAALLPQLS